jgi:hypothetical protein
MNDLVATDSEVPPPRALNPFSELSGSCCAAESDLVSLEA